jgi:hypothetical protein
VTPKQAARPTVILLRFFSIMLVPEKVDGRAPPNALERPVPFPECKRIATINPTDNNPCTILSNITTFAPPRNKIYEIISYSFIFQQPEHSLDRMTI